MVLVVALLLLVTFAFLIWRDHLRPRPDDRWEEVAQDSRKAPRGRRKVEVLVDGSNVMHWADDTPQLDSLKKVVADLTAKGYTPGVIFDANVGYKLFGRYRDDFYMARCLGLPTDQVLVVPKGEPADRILLEASRERMAPIVTRDRFRDWGADFPEVNEPGRLVRGGITDGKVWIELDRVA